jgi:hypothetical protein
LRLPDWLPRLTATVQAWQNRPFEYGSTDCLQFLADCLLAVRGVDYRDRFPVYSSELGAGRILIRHGGLCGLITSVLGPPRLAREAKPGDAIAGLFCKQLTAGVCVGGRGITTGPDGLIRVPLEAALYSWSV